MVDAALPREVLPVHRYTVCSGASQHYLLLLLKLGILKQRTRYLSSTIAITDYLRLYTNDCSRTQHVVKKLPLIGWGSDIRATPPPWEDIESCARFRNPDKKPWTIALVRCKHEARSIDFEN